MLDIKISFPRIHDFTVNWSWSKFMYIAKKQPTIPHIHDACEIYINVSGNVSFMVENHVYPISHGDIIITKPHEYHHCIYNKDCTHEHFWILIPVENNDCLLSCFLNRENGKDNLISLPADMKEQLLSECFRIEELANSGTSKLELYAAFLQLLVIIEQGYENKYSSKQVILPAELSAILNYINTNYTLIENIKDLAHTFHMSQNTLDRLFRKYLSISPSAYIEAKRLANAKLLLINNKTVLEACLESGFSDYSHFISKFKKQFGITPLKYKNSSKL